MGHPAIPSPQAPSSKVTPLHGAAWLLCPCVWKPDVWKSMLVVHQSYQPPSSADTEQQGLVTSSPSSVEQHQLQHICRRLSWLSTADYLSRSTHLRQSSSPTKGRRFQDISQALLSSAQPFCESSPSDHYLHNANWKTKYINYKVLWQHRLASLINLFGSPVNCARAAQHNIFFEGPKGVNLMSLTTSGTNL